MNLLTFQDIRLIYRTLFCIAHTQLFMTLCAPMNCSTLGISVHGSFPSKNTAMGCHFLLQGIFPTQGLNPHLFHLLHWQAESLPLSPPGKPLSLVHTSEDGTGLPTHMGQWWTVIIGSRLWYWQEAGFVAGCVSYMETQRESLLGRGLMC